MEAVVENLLSSTIPVRKLQHTQLESLLLTTLTAPTTANHSANLIIMPAFNTQQLYYDGKPQLATSGETFQTIDPSTATPLANVQSASNTDTDAAVASAKKAFPAWAATPAVNR